MGYYNKWLGGTMEGMNEKEIKKYIDGIINIRIQQIDADIGYKVEIITSQLFENALFMKKAESKVIKIPNNLTFSLVFCISLPP